MQLFSDLLALLWSGYVYDPSFRHTNNPLGGTFNHEFECQAGGLYGIGVSGSGTGSTVSTPKDPNNGNDGTGFGKGQDSNSDNDNGNNGDNGNNDDKTDCCGKYPSRYPYKLKEHTCCSYSQTLYNTLISECCTGGVVNLHEGGC